MPLSDHTIKVGATYDREDLSPERTDAQLKTLALSAANLIDLDIDVIAHEAGIRPNILGHFPVAGRHPKQPRLAILNGLGSKGVLFAPYTAALMVAHLLHNEPLPKEVDLKRFIKA